MSRSPSFEKAKKDKIFPNKASYARGLFFNHVVTAAPDPILDIALAFNAEKDPQKVNLSAGLYRDKTLKTPILKTVKKAEALLLEEEKSKEYFPIDGNKNFIDKIGALIFGDFFWMNTSSKICGIQTPGGTGALRLGGEFLKKEVGEKIALPDPTWPNHRGIFTQSGMQIEPTPYYDFTYHLVDFERYADYLKRLPPGTAILLHACCHNPTGADLSLDQWKSVSDLCHQHGLLPFFDFAYQGLGRSLEEDAGAIRLFVKEGHEIIVAYSLSKNFGLYGERTGAFFILTESESVAKNVTSKLKSIARANYSNPPIHGAKLALQILSTPSLKLEWEKEVEEMKSRMIELRTRFAKKLCGKVTKRDFQFLFDRSGMFCFLGLDKDQVSRLAKEDKIFMTQDGRINIAGLNDENIDYVVNAIVKVV